MYDSILLPTEANPGAEDAISLAIDLAERYGAELQILYIVEDTGNTFAHMSAEERRGNLPPEGEEAISNVENAARDADVPTGVRIGIGEPDESIIRHRNRANADFVVMGTHGRTGIDRLLVGSVAETVVRRTDVPVLVVPLSDSA